jgi:acetyl-CoA carboxylase beta subunit
MAQPRIDVSIEQKGGLGGSSDDGRKHPNTCPACGSHYREDELDRHLGVCPQCGHHFSLTARERIEQLADPGSFVEEETDLRSTDPLGFFDLRPYTERLAEAELKTGEGDAIVIGRADIQGEPCQLSVMDFGFLGGSMGSVVGE